MGILKSDLPQSSGLKEKIPLLERESKRRVVGSELKIDIKIESKFNSQYQDGLFMSSKCKHSCISNEALKEVA